MLIYSRGPKRSENKILLSQERENRYRANLSVLVAQRYEITPSSLPTLANEFTARSS